MPDKTDLPDLPDLDEGDDLPDFPDVVHHDEIPTQSSASMNTLRVDNTADPRKAFLRTVADKVLDKPDLGREDSYSTIASFWTTYLHGLGLDGDIRIEDYDVALMMDLFKTARLLHDPHHADSWVDKAGYAVGGHEKAVTERPKPQEG